MVKVSKGRKTVGMTVTVPLSIASALDEEAEIMGTSYSECVATVIRIGLDARRATRVQETKL